MECWRRIGVHLDAFIGVAIVILELFGKIRAFRKVAASCWRILGTKIQVLTLAGRRGNLHLRALVFPLPIVLISLMMGIANTPTSWSQQSMRKAGRQEDRGGLVAEPQPRPGFRDRPRNDTDETRIECVRCPSRLCFIRATIDQNVRATRKLLNHGGHGEHGGKLGF
jgi:hypothetical protein